MHHAMRSSAALAVAALLGVSAAPAEPGKAAQPAKPAHPAAQPAQPAKPAQSARERGGEGRGKPDEAPGSRGKSAAAHETAPGQGDHAPGKHNEPETAGESKHDEGKQGERGRTRDKRRQEHRDQIHGKYGSELLQRPAILAELKTHAWRMARLERMRALADAVADATKRKKTIDRLDKLIEKEKARHDRGMDHLKDQGAKAEPEHAGKAAGPPEKRAEKTGGGQ